MQKELLKKYVYNNIESFPEDEFDEFYSYFSLKTIQKKELLLQQEDTCQFEAFITKGCFRLYTTDNSGNEHTLYFGIQNWWVTDLGSFINQTPATLSVQALEDSEVLMINKPNKEKAFVRFHWVEKLFRVMTQRSHIALQNRMIDNISQSADQRYLDFITKYPEISQRLTNIQIASYLGISHEFVSKIRRKIVSKK